MKRIIFITITLTGIIFFGCNPNKELYDKLDEQKEPYKEDIKYTLKPSDYEDVKDLALEDAVTTQDSAVAYSIEENESFTDEAPASEYIPAFLEYKFQALKKNSSVKVTYNYTPPYLEVFSSVFKDTLDQEYYDSLDVSIFSPDDAPGDLIPTILDSVYNNPSIGSLVNMYYDYEDAYGTSSLDDSYFYRKQDKWEVLPDVYEMTTADYTSIDGITGDYFLSSSEAMELLPKFLEEKFPYAEVGKNKVVSYDYDNGDNVVIGARQFVKDSTGWLSVVKKTSQFVHGGNNWAFDPTVRFKMAPNDYQLIVDARDSKWVDSYGTGEFYSGANSYYENFDLRISERIEYEPETFQGLGNEEAMEIIWDRVVNDALILMLQKKFPDATPKVSGIEVFYHVTFETYNNDYTHSVYTAVFKCVGSGDPPQFDFISIDPDPGYL
jgi:hypothetical protein